MNKRDEKFERNRHQLQLAALGVVSLPGAAPLDATGKPGPRQFATLEAMAKHTSLWVRWLGDAMLRSGKGFRVQTQKRRPPKGAARWCGERRPDKLEEIAREKLIPMVRGKINFRRSDRGRKFEKYAGFWLRYRGRA